MATSKQWLPGTRQGQLDMAAGWHEVLSENTENETGEPVKKWTLWGIPPEVFADFGLKLADARAALAEAKNEETRTKVVNQKVARTFKALAEAMREMKKRFFHVPPLRDEDIISLKLVLHDRTHTISGEPTAQVVVETFLVGRGQLGIRLIYVSGDSHDRANKGFRIYYKLIAQGEAAPASAADIPDSFPERRKSFVRDFEGCSGMTAYFYVRIENGRLIGPAGPITSALIP